jgi:hypothetical protein
MFQECHTTDFFFKNTKGFYFFKNIIGCYFLRILQMLIVLMSFIDNWLNQFSFFNYEFFKSRSWSPKGPLMSRT